MRFSSVFSAFFGRREPVGLVPVLVELARAVVRDIVVVEEGLLQTCRRGWEEVLRRESLDSNGSSIPARMSARAF